MTVIKNLIFDLGGVILDLSVPATLNGFAHLSGLSPDQVTQLFKSSKGFEEYERGEISDDEFRAFVRTLYNIDVPDQDLDHCWNAMLLGIPPEKLELLKVLKNQYRVYLLSNTNNIHLAYINTNIIPMINGVSTLDGYFHRAYYSHLMKKRKPEPEIFLEVLEDNKLLPHETLFLDDNADNIAGAKAVGIETAFVNTTNFILDYFK
jgi:glucose-1-phosphatase